MSEKLAQFSFAYMHISSCLLRRRFANEFLLDLVFRAAVDEQGNQIKGCLDARFWERMAQKDAPVQDPSNSSVFEQENEPEKAEEFKQPERDEATPAIKSFPDPQKPLNGESTFDDLEAYVQGFLSIFLCT